MSDADILEMAVINNVKP